MTDASSKIDVRRPIVLDLLIKILVHYALLYVTAHVKLSHLSANFTTSYEP